MLDCHIKGNDTNYVLVWSEDVMTAISHILAKSQAAYEKCERFALFSDEELTSVLFLLKNEELI
jgi:hypothetical protein